MNQIFSQLHTLNNRELALLYWIIFLIFLSVMNAKVRKEIYDTVKVLTSPKLLLFFIPYFLVLLFSTHFLILNGFIVKEQFNQIIFWFFLKSFNSMLKLDFKETKSSLLRKIILSDISIIAVIQFISNLESFNLILEILVVPFLLLLYVSSEFGGSDKNRKVFRYIFYSFIFLITLISISLAVSNIKKYLDILTLKKIFLPIVYSIITFPLLYFTSYIGQLEYYFLKLNFFTSNLIPWETLKLKTYIIFITRIDLGKINTLKNSKSTNLHECQNLQDFKSIIKKELNDC